MAKKINDDQAGTTPQDTEYEYLLAEADTVQVSHDGVIYPVVKGKISCTLIVALELVEAGVLRAFH